nr:MAG TPA_asm: hypothetical protein [Caudoviricetes sp.]
MPKKSRSVKNEKLDKSRMKGYLYLSTLLFYHAHSAMECHLFIL